MGPCVLEPEVRSLVLTRLIQMRSATVQMRSPLMTEISTTWEDPLRETRFSFMSS